MLIRKDFKLTEWYSEMDERLRVLLIRKDFKLNGLAVDSMVRLRVLLIRKDFKHLQRELLHRQSFESLVNTEGF